MITITIAAVPDNNPGNASDPNVLLIAVIENVKVLCTHENQTWSKTETAGEITCVCSICGETAVKMCEHENKNLVGTDDPTVYSAVCNVCEVNMGNINGINADGNTVYTPDVFSTIIRIAEGGNKTHTLATTITNYTDPNYNNMPFTRIEVTADATHGESYIYVTTTGAELGKYIAVIYRSVGVTASEMYISKPGQGLAGGMNIDKPTPSFSTTSVGFQLAVFDFTSKTNWDENTGIGTFRWDMNNRVTKGSTFDVASLAFFDSMEAAEAFYDQFVEKYELNKRFKFLINTNGLKVDGVVQTLDMNGSNAGAVLGNILKQDFTGVVLSTHKSITVSSWCAAINGITAYKLIISDGTTTETVHWANASGNRTDICNAVLKEHPGYGFTDQCGVGAAMPSAIDLSAFCGKTVDVQIVAEAIGLGQIILGEFTNISVPYYYKAYGSDLVVSDVKDIVVSRDDEGNLVATGKKATDANFVVFNYNSGVPGRYIAITYKTTDTQFDSIFLKGYLADGTYKGWTEYQTFATEKIGEWCIGIVDVYAILGEGAKVCTLRFDVCQSSDAVTSISIAGVEMHDDLAALNRSLGTAIWSRSGEKVTYKTLSNLTGAYNSDGELVVTSTGNNTDAYIMFFEGGQKIYARYAVVTVRAGNANSKINEFYAKGAGTGWIHYADANIHEHAGESITVIVDLSAKTDANGKSSMPVTTFRMDCTQGGSNRFVIIESLEFYNDLEMAVESAGSNKILTVDFTLPQ